MKNYGIELMDIGCINNMDGIILAVAHKEFQNLTMERVDGFYGSDKKVLIDVKGQLNRKEFEMAGYYYWKL